MRPERLRRVVAGLLVGMAWLCGDASAAPPGPPLNLRATVSGTTVALAWDNGMGPAPVSFIVEASLSFAGLPIATLPVSGRQLTVPNVPHGRYFVRVRAVNADGVSAASNEIVLVVPGGSAGCTTAPHAPRALTGSSTGTVVMLGWDPPANGCAPTSYLVRAGSGPGLSNIAVVNVGLMTSLSAAAPPGVYHIDVVALNAYGTSAASNEVILTVGAPTPSGSLTGRWVQGYTAVVCVISPNECRLPGSRAAFAMSLQLQQSGNSITGQYFLKYDDVRAISLRKEAYGDVVGTIVNGQVTLTLTPTPLPLYGNYGGTITGVVQSDFNRFTATFSPTFTSSDPRLPRDTVALPAVNRCSTCPPIVRP